MQIKDLTQAELARRVENLLPEGHEFGRDQISNYVNKRSLPKLGRRKFIADALGVPYNELFPPEIYADEVEGDDEAPTRKPLEARLRPLTLCDEEEGCKMSELGPSGLNVVQLGNGRVRLTIQQEMSCEKAVNILVSLRA